ncbi:hypothetical protein MMC21_001401 [Puttea exsequens]|nr:hypothetical protein [Puttea exsequens]
MSANSTPIPPQRFAEAIKELPHPNLHFKAAEIRNSISHLEFSNQQLQGFANGGDRDCAEAIQENVVVIQRMEERLRLLKAEVEGRGFRWGEDEMEAGRGAPNVNGVINSQTNGSGQRISHVGGSLGNEELARRSRENIDEGQDGDSNDGINL